MPTDILPAANSPSAFCPGCLGKMSAASTFCASCGSQTAIEVSVAKLANAKTAYAVARTLQNFDPQAIPSVAELAKSLQTRNLHLRSTKNWLECEALVESLSVSQVAATIRLVVVTPKDNSLKAMLRRPAVQATTGIAIAACAAFLWMNGRHNAIAPQVTVQSPSPIQLDGSTGDFQGSVVRKKSVPAETVPEVALRDTAEATPSASPTQFSFENVRRSIVTLKTQNGQGSGFLVHSGYILTNHHVLDGLTQGGSVDVLFTGNDGKPRTVSARVHRFHTSLDLGVVQCTQECESLPVLPLGRSVLLDSGATVYAIGSPLGLALTLSKGILSNAGRNLDGALFLQSDVQVNPGNSGGPLLNDRGEVVGIVTAKVNGAEGISFVLPIEYATQGPDAILDGLPNPAPPYDAEFSARLAALEGSHGRGSESASVRAEEAAKDRIALVTAAISAQNSYYVKFRVKWNPTSAMPPNGPFYIVIQQKSTGYKGTFQLSDLRSPTKLGEMEGGALVYEFEHVGAFQGVSKFDLGDKVSLRMRDDIFSNTIELTRR